MKIRRKTAILSISLVLSLSFFSGCSFFGEKPLPNNEKEGEQKAKKTIAVQLKGEPAGLDPLKINSTVTLQITSNIFEGLLKYKENSFELEPCLAQKWEVKEEGKEVLFTLRKNVQFHDGTPFNSDAVVVNFERIRSNGAKIMDFIQKVEKVEDYTIKFVLNQPYTPFLPSLAMSITTPILSPSSLKKPEELATKPVGTGPFKLKKWEPQKELVLERNENYWEKKPALDLIVFRLDANSTNNARSLLGTGELDIIDLDKSKEDKNAYYYKAQTPMTTFLAFNCSKPPFDNLNARKAVAKVMNRKELVEKYFGDTVFATSFIPPEIAGHNSQVNFYDHNASEARELMKKVNLKDSKVYAVDVYFQNPALYTELKNSFKQIGLELEVLDNLQEEEFGRVIAEGGYDLVLAYWQCDNGDPDNFTQLVNSKAVSDNLSRYANPAVDELIKKAREKSSPEERNTLYKSIQEKVQEDVPLIPFFHAGRTYGFSQRIKNFSVHPSGVIQFKYLEVTD